METERVIVRTCKNCRVNEKKCPLKNWDDKSKRYCPAHQLKSEEKEK